MSTDKFTEDGQKHFGRLIWHGMDMLSLNLKKKKKKNAKKDLQKTKTKQQKILLYEQTKNEFTHYGQNKLSYSRFYSFSQTEMKKWGFVLKLL